MSFRPLRGRGAGAPLLAAFSLVSFVDPTLAADDSKLRWTPEEVVVTARRESPYVATDASTLRTGVPILATPQSVQVLTRELLDDQENNTLDEALGNVSGVIPSLAAEALLANPIVRGFESEIFVDGLIGYGDTAVGGPGSLWNVERVEVAKGPTSTLFGGGIGAPVGGLINLVSKTPQRASFTKLRVRGGSFNTYAGAIDANLPRSDSLGVRLVGEYQNAEDNIDAVTIERLLLAPSLRWQPRAGTELRGRVTYSRVEQLEYVGLPAFLKDEPLIDPERFTSSTSAPRSRVENLNLDLGLTQRFTPTMNGTLRVKRFSNSFDEYSTSPFLALFPCAGTVCPQLQGTLPVDVDEWTVDASLSAQISGGSVSHTLLAGVQWDRVDYDGATGFDFENIRLFDYADRAADLPFAIPPIDTVVRNRYETVAAYMQDQIAIGERLHLLASVRFSRLRLQEIEGGASNDETYSEIDPRIGVSYGLTEGLSVFAGYATGSRLSIFFNGANSPKPERSRSAEAGIKFALLSFGLTGTIAAYQSTRTNVPTPDPTTFFTSIQTGEQRARGAELDVIYEPTRAFSLLASYGYTDADVRRDTVVPVGSRLPRVPTNRGRLATRYRFLGGSLSGLELGAGVMASSAAVMTLPNALQSDAYTVFDAQASYDFGSLELGLRLDNLFDRKYFLPYQYFTQDAVRPGNRRSAFLTISIDF